MENYFDTCRSFYSILYEKELPDDCRLFANTFACLCGKCNRKGTDEPEMWANEGRGWLWRCSRIGKSQLKPFDIRRWHILLFTPLDSRVYDLYNYFFLFQSLPAGLWVWRFILHLQDWGNIIIIITIIIIVIMIIILLLLIIVMIIMTIILMLKMVKTIKIIIMLMITIIEY